MVKKNKKTDNGPFKLFAVTLEETVERSTTLLVRAHTLNDAKALDTSDLCEGLDEYAWDSDSFGPRVSRCEQLPPEEVDEDPEVWATVDGDKWLDEKEFKKVVKKWNKEQRDALKKPLPGQMGIPGVAEDIPKE